jgi:gluconokinase
MTTPSKPSDLPLVLALDIGTSSVRSLLFDSETRVVDGVEARRAHAFRVGPDGAVEADAAEILRLLCECIDETLVRAGNAAARIGGVAACTFVSNVLGVDAQRRASTPVITYADTRAAPDADALRTRFDEHAVHQRTGCHFHPSYWPARFLWLARVHPEWLAQTARWLSLGDYLLLALFGVARVSYSVASWTGLLNRERLDWDEDLLAALPVSRAQLSPLCDVGDAFRGLRPEFAARWPSLAHVPWFPAIGDGAAANVGSGCVVSGRVAVTVGTTSAVRVVVTGDVGEIPQGLWCYRVDREHALLGGALTEGGSVFAWAKQTFQLGSDAVLEVALAACEPDGHGLTFLPLLGGERSPGWRGDLRGAILGLSLATTPVEIVRAALEGVAFRIGLIYRLLSAALPADPTVVISGGAVLQSPVWVQIIADVLGVSIRASTTPEASARGTALLALREIGLLRRLEDAPDCLGARYEPDKARHARYMAAMQRQQALYSVVRDGMM